MSELDLSSEPIKISETSAIRLMQSTVDGAERYQDCCIMVGAPGVGKTTFLNKFARARETAILIEATSANGAKSQFFKLLADHISEHNRHYRRATKQSLSDLFEMLCEVLWNYMPKGTIILIDEAQNLALDTFRLLLDLSKRCGITIVFVGNTYTLKNTKVNREAIDQIWDRLEDHRLELRGISSGDVVAIAVDHYVEGVDAYAYLEAFAISRKSLRRLASLLREARIYAGPQGSIRLPHLRKAVAVLHSEGEDRGLFKLIPKPRKEENAA